MATQRFKVFKETGVPGAWVANALYFIKDPAKTYVEVYITSSTAVPQRMINEDDIQALINSTVSSTNEVLVVDTIAARNLLTLTRTSSVFVKNATGDGTATSVASFKAQMSMDGIKWYDASADVPVSATTASMTIIPITVGIIGRFIRVRCTAAGSAQLMNAIHISAVN